MYKVFLSKIYRIIKDEAQNILELKTQLNNQDDDSNLPRNFISNGRMLRYPRIDCFFFSDTLFPPTKSKSSCGYTCIQLVVLYKGYMKKYGTKYTTYPPAALKLFVKEVGIPNIFLVDHN